MIRPNSRQLRRAKAPHLALISADASLVETLRKSTTGKPTIYTIETFANVDKALQHLTSRPPDAVLIETENAAAGINSAEKLNLALPDTPTIILAPSLDPLTVLHAAMVGVRGLLLHTTKPPELIKAVRDVIVGRQVFGREAVAALLDALNSANSSAASRFSSQELNIIGHLFGKHSNKEISQAMGIGTGTVHFHLNSLYKKLGAHTRDEALRKFMASMKEPRPKSTGSGQ